MRKFLLVTLVGMVLVMDLYGIVAELISNYKVEEIEHSYTIVSVE